MMAVGSLAFAAIKADVKSVDPNGITASPTNSTLCASAASTIARAADFPSSVLAVIMNHRVPYAFTNCGTTALAIIVAFGINTNVCELHAAPVSPGRYEPVN